MRKPAPKHVATECSVCGQDWAKHENLAKKAKRQNPNLDDCVTLLKAALAARLNLPAYWQDANSAARLNLPAYWQDANSAANQSTTWAVSGPNQQLYQ